MLFCSGWQLASVLPVPVQALTRASWRKRGPLGPCGPLAGAEDAVPAGQVHRSAANDGCQSGFAGGTIWEGVRRTAPQPASSARPPTGSRGTRSTDAPSATPKLGLPAEFACLTACHEQTLVVRRQPDAVDRLLAQQHRADCDAQLAIVGASTKVAAAFYELRELCGVCAATPHAINWSSTRRRSSARCLGTQTSKRRATASSMF